MDLKQAERTVKLVSLLNFISIFISILLSYFPDWLERIEFPLGYFHYLTYCIPWFFPGELAIGMVIVSILTLFVYFTRSKVAAFLLLAIFILDRFISIIFLFWFDSIPQLYSISWLCITLIWGLILIYGIKGTFVYHHLNRQQPAISESDGK